LKGEVVAARESNPDTPLCCFCQHNVAVWCFELQTVFLS
jgi:hypothetical protein